MCAQVWGETKLSWRFKAATNPKPARAEELKRETHKLAEPEKVPPFSFQPQKVSLNL
jgi:hypothetical protein